MHPLACVNYTHAHDVYFETPPPSTGSPQLGEKSSLYQLAFEATLDSLPIHSETSDASTVREPSQGKPELISNCLFIFVFTPYLSGVARGVQRGLEHPLFQLHTSSDRANSISEKGTCSMYL